MGGDRLERLQRAREQCGRLAQRHPSSRALKSIIEQLTYLIGLETGSGSDRGWVRTINIGALAAREVEDLDPELAGLLHAIAEDVRWR